MLGTAIINTQSSMLASSAVPAAMACRPPRQRPSMQRTVLLAKLPRLVA